MKHRGTTQIADRLRRRREVSVRAQHHTRRLETLNEVVRVARKLGHWPNTVEYMQHGEITLTVLWRRFGSWPQVLKAAKRIGIRSKRHQSSGPNFCRVTALAIV